MESIFGINHLFAAVNVESDIPNTIAFDDRSYAKIAGRVSVDLILLHFELFLLVEGFDDVLSYQDRDLLLLRLLECLC